MVKHMLINNKGFSLIETLFVLFIITILSLMTMTIHIPQKNDHIVIHELSELIHQAKLNSMLYKETTTVSFSSHSLSISSSHLQDDYILPENMSLDKHTITFNEFGNIHYAKTVQLHASKNYKFVFQIGSGSFYVQ